MSVCLAHEMALTDVYELILLSLGVCNISSCVSACLVLELILSKLCLYLNMLQVFVRVVVLTAAFTVAPSRVGWVAPEILGP